jgi:hypothetical protein
MSMPSTQVNLTTDTKTKSKSKLKSAVLALYIGETYAEVEIRLIDSKKKIKSDPVFKKNYFLPQSSLKTTMSQINKEMAEHKLQICDVYIVCRYLERLKTFRLGGSVIQVVHKGFENSYAVENTSRVSLAAAALVISIDKDSTNEFLNAELTRIRKINPESNKVALELDPEFIPSADIERIKFFFTELNFKIFECRNPQNLPNIRKTLLNAGSEGTKEEIISEIKGNFADAIVYFWINNGFQATDSKSYENFDLYFSSQDFLAHFLKQSRKNKLIHFDLESWMILGSETKNIWDSPWGLIERKHHTTSSIALHPLTEILIDETSRLQFSKAPASPEPGPMIAGRGVKSLLIDLFWNHICENPDLKSLFPSLETSLLQTKIESQFKVLEKGQRSESKALTKSDLIEFVRDLIDFELELKLGHPVSEYENTVWTGHLAKLVHPKANPFSWTENIFAQIGQA